MADFQKGNPNRASTTEAFPRSTWKAPGAEQGPYAIALDQGAKLHLNINRASGDPIIVVLTEAVPDDHLAELRRDGISYIFAGRSEIDLALYLSISFPDSRWACIAIRPAECPRMMSPAADHG
jgi:hypothetical protein